MSPATLVRDRGRPGRTAKRRRRRQGLACVAVAGACIAGVAILATKVMSSGGPTTPSACQVASIDGKGIYSLGPVQAQNAAIIAAVAQRKHLPDHAATVALAAALQESQLLNLPYGDRDSLGLFQQRPSQGWGSPTQLLNPDYAASAFYDALVKIDGWQTMAVTDAAQAVQHSAAASAYAAWEPEARSFASALTGEVPAGLTCHLDGFSGSVPAAGALAGAASEEFGQPALGMPLAFKLGWQVAIWAVTHAYAYHIRSVTYDNQTWTMATGKWTHDYATTHSPDTVTIG